MTDLATFFSDEQVRLVTGALVVCTMMVCAAACVVKRGWPF